MNDSNLFNKSYDPQKIEQDIQKKWEKNQQFKAVENDPKFPKGKYYACSMLPYPSGRLHMGHVRNYTINDVIARWKRMIGFNVLMPMGWDAFGLPAENAAMAKNLSPSKWTNSNIASMKKQLEALGLAIDWSREFSTCSPNYYKWNQWLFLKMLKNGIAYQKTGLVNWDPVDKTVLANEQVIDGVGWRSGAKIEKREIPMYYLSITKYSKTLLNGLKNLDWPVRVKTMQDNWIGRSTGLTFSFFHEIRDQKDVPINDGQLSVFTTRPDTIMGVTFVAISVEHPIADYASKIDPKVADFIQSCKSVSQTEAELAIREKEGVFTGLLVNHPLTSQKVPLWISNYVIMSYGDGAVMGVPAHDERDFYFAKKYGINIKQVIQPVKNSKKNYKFDSENWKDWYAVKENSICINSNSYDGLTREKAVDKITSDIEKLKIGKKTTQTRLRDWGISRQRYWGTPIPIINCKVCGSVPVPEENLPVILPENLKPDGLGNPLRNCKEFYETKCPKCSGDAHRETDTMDTFIDSSWYFLRYCSFNSEKSMVDSRVDYWMPMDKYIGGIEHAVLHLLYARFWTKVMKNLGLVNFEEPFDSLLTQGMVLNQTFFKKDKSNKSVFFNPDEVSVQRNHKGKVIGANLVKDNSELMLGGSEKMSKSKNNGVDPQKIIDLYGADTARLFTIFASPPEQTLEWSSDAMEGSHKFLKRLWNFCFLHQEKVSKSSIHLANGLFGKNTDSQLRTQTYEILKQADTDIRRYHFNTVVSAVMKLLNTLEKSINVNSFPPETKKSELGNSYEYLVESISILLRILYPIAPHITETIWDKIGFFDFHGSLVTSKWPAIDKFALQQKEMDIVLQINGKMRSNLKVSSTANDDEIIKTAIESDAYKKFSLGLRIQKTIIVPNRLINIVLEKK